MIELFNITPGGIQSIKASQPISLPRNQFSYHLSIIPGRHIGYVCVGLGTGKKLAQR